MNKPLFAATLLLAAATPLLAPTRGVAAPTGIATASYNPATGNLALDVGSGLGTVGIESIGHVILPQTFVPPAQAVTADVVAYFNAAGFTPFTTTLRFDPGLIQDDFYFNYFPLGGDEIRALVIIPEPGATVILIIGIAVASSSVRRRGRRRGARRASNLRRLTVNIATTCGDNP